MTERRADNSYYAQLNTQDYIPTEDELIAEFIGQGFEFEEAKQLAKIRWSELEAERLHASFIRSKYNNSSSAKTTEEMFAEMDAKQRRLELERERAATEKQLLDAETAERINDLQTFLIALRRTGENTLADQLNAFIVDTERLFISDNNKAFRTAYDKLVLQKLKKLGNIPELERQTNIMNTYFQDYEDEMLEYGGKKGYKRKSHRRKSRKQKRGTRQRGKR